MGVRSFLAGQVVRPLLKALEGRARPGPWPLSISGGWLSAEAGRYQNWWQLGYSVEGGFPRNPIVEACIASYAESVAMCLGTHWQANARGGRDRVTTSALSRILKQPNDYQTTSQFLVTGITHLLSEGNFYALALRNDRYEIDELHFLDSRAVKVQ